MKIGIFKKIGDTFQKVSLNSKSFDDYYFIIFDDKILTEWDKICERDSSILSIEPVSSDDAKILPLLGMYIKFLSSDENDIVQKLQNIKVLLSKQSYDYNLSSFITSSFFNLPLESIKNLNKLEDDLESNILKNSFYISKIFKKHKDSEVYKRIIERIISLNIDELRKYATDTKFRKSIEVLGIRLTQLMESYAKGVNSLKVVSLYIYAGGFINDISCAKNLEFVIKAFLEKEKNISSFAEVSSDIISFFSNFSSKIDYETFYSVYKSIDINSLTLTQQYMYFNIMDVILNVIKEKDKVPDYKETIKNISKDVQSVIRNTYLNNSWFRDYGYFELKDLNDFLDGDFLKAISSSIYNDLLNGTEISVNQSMFYFSLLISTGYKSDISLATVKKLLYGLYKCDFKVNKIYCRILNEYIEVPGVEEDLEFYQLMSSITKDYTSMIHKKANGKTFVDRNSVEEPILLYIDKLDKNKAFKFMIENQYFAPFSSVLNPIKYFEHAVKYFSNKKIIHLNHIIYILKHMITNYNIEYSKVIKILKRNKISPKLACRITVDTPNPITEDPRAIF